MKKLLMASCLLSAPALAVNGVNPGSSMTYGPTATEFSTFAGTYNPAMAPLMVDEDEKFRMNFFPSISMSTEIGDVSNFADDLDELIDILDDPSTANEDSYQQTLARFNEVLEVMGQEGYLKNSINISVPVTPLYVNTKSLGGTFYAEANVGAQVSIGVLNRILQADVQGDEATFNTDTSLYLKSGIEKKLSIGYGTEFLEATFPIVGSGKLYLGTKVNFYSIELSKQITRLIDLDGEEVGDVISDEYDKNLNSSSGIGIDVGAVWDAEWYRVGARLQNINEPSFDYGAVGVNCENRPDGIEENSCFIAGSFADEGRINRYEKHTKHALLSLDFGFKITDRWVVNSTFDTAAYSDLVGYSNQNFNVSTAYDTKGWLIPDVRIGYQENLTGTKTSSYLVGLTLFNVFTLDVEYGTDSVEVDDSSAPRRFGFAIGFEESF